LDRRSLVGHFSRRGDGGTFFPGRFRRGQTGSSGGREASVQDQHETPNRANPLVQATLLGEALEGAHVAAVLFDDDRTCVAVNAYACELTGHTRVEMLDRLVDVGPDFDDIVARRRNAGRTELRRKDGTMVAVGYRVMTTAIGGIAFFLGLFWPE
jgi:PAS domain-containing protein